jgi:hypothetical protein
VQPDDGFAYPPVTATPTPTPATGRTHVGTEIVYPDPPQALPDGPSYQINGSLDLTGYRYAHAVGARGQGVTVAVVDSGVGAQPLLESAVLPGIDVTGDRLPGYAGDGRLDADGHGTAVAGLIASRGADRWASMIGVAPASMIVPVRVESVNPSPGIDPRTVQQGVQAAPRLRGMPRPAWSISVWRPRRRRLRCGTWSITCATAVRCWWPQRATMAGPHPIGRLPTRPWRADM